MHHYQVATLNLESDIELAGLPDGDGRQATVRISRGDVPAELRNPLQVGPGYQADARDVLLQLGTLRCLVRDGTDVIVSSQCQADEDALAMLLLGPALGVLAHQNGLVPLSASAVNIGGHAVLLAGGSASGKSTLTAHLTRRGHALLSDDIVLAIPTGDATVQPGVQFIRLWPDALIALGFDPPSTGPDRPGLERRRLPPPLKQDGELELGAIYVLEWSPSAPPDNLVAVTGIEALRAVEEAVLLPGVLAASHGLGERFRRVAALISGTQVTKWRRRMGYDDLDRQAAALEAHFEILMGKRSGVDKGFDRNAPKA